MVVYGDLLGMATSNALNHPFFSPEMGSVNYPKWDPNGRFLIGLATLVAHPCVGKRPRFPPSKSIGFSSFSPLAGHGLLQGEAIQPSYGTS